MKVGTIRDLYEWAKENDMLDAPIGLQYQSEAGTLEGNTFEEWGWYRPDLGYVEATVKTKKFSDHKKTGTFKKTESIKYILLE